jgi:nitrate reductase beta subunit
MEYPYEQALPERQWAGVFDINKCIGCQSCSLACKTTWTNGRGQEYMFWNNVETKPYGFHPLGWDVRTLEILGTQKWTKGVYRGKTILEAAGQEERTAGFTPSDEDWAYPNIGEDEIVGGSVPRGMYINKLPHPVWFFYLPRTCNHCTYPGCLAACPRKAIYKREDGVVLIDQKRCRGYKKCLKGCPYKKPMFRSHTGRSEKCIGCYPKIEQDTVSQCFEMCIGKIRTQGFLNTPENADPDNPVDFLVHIKKVALPSYPQFGTAPNIYYIPPVHVPMAYLVQTFGPGVKRAVETYRNAREDEKLIGAILLTGSSPKRIHSFEVKAGQAIGYDGKGHEVASVPIKEPTVIRPHYDKRLDVYRLDVT